MKITIIKKGLIIYLAALVAGIIFASFYGGPVAYAPLFALFLIIPVSIIYIVLNYAFLRVYQEVEVHKLTKGEEHKYRALVENAGFLPIHNMEIGTFKSRCNLYEIPDKTKTTPKSCLGNLMERATGIEPASQPWEGRVLPLNHARIPLL